MYICIMCVLCLQRPEESIGFPETVVSYDCEPFCGCLEWDPGLLEEQPVLFGVISLARFGRIDRIIFERVLKFSSFN